MLKEYLETAVRLCEKNIFWIIAAAGFLLRLIYWWEFAALPHFPFAVGPDVQEYHERALELLQGSIFPSEPEIHAPLYSFFLAFLYKITSCSIPAVRLIQLLINFVSYVALAKLLGKFSRNSCISNTFLALSLFTPVLFFHQAELISESLLAPLLTAFFYLIYYARRNFRCYCGAGAVLGCLLLTHGLMSFFAAGEIIYWMILRRWRQTGLLIAGIMLVILPVITVKSFHYHKFTGIQANSIFNLWIGHNPDATGGCYLRPGKWEKTLSSFHREAAQSNIQENFLLLKKIGRFYVDEPEKLLILPVKKLFLLLDPREPVAGADNERLIRMTYTQIIGAGMMAVVLILGGCGIYFAFRKREKQYIHFYILTASLACGLLLTIVSGRYRQGMMPGLLLLAALGAYHLGKKSWAIILPAVFAGGILISAAATRPWSFYPEASSVIGEAYFHRKDWFRAWHYLSSAASAIEYPERYGNMLGAVAEETGDWKEAEYRYRKVIESAPEHPDAFLNLGHLYFYHFPHKRSDALVLIYEALKRKAQLPSAYDMLGQHFAQTGNFSAALTMFEKACLYAPENQLYQKKLELCRQMTADRRMKNAPESRDR